MTIETSIRPTHVPFLDLIDLANEKVGGKVLATNDDFFAAKDGLLKFAAPIFIADKYTEFGKWMDGWESRRKRNLGPGNDHDWCVIRLGLPGVVRGVNVDTAFFTGNFPEYCSIEACSSLQDPGEDSRWTEILPKSKLLGGTQNLFSISDPSRWTHLRLRIFPDGGVARLRVHGEVLPDLKKLKQASDFDLAAAENGGVVVTCNDHFFGTKDNLILPGRAATMGDGWETRRKRGPGNDWIVVKLATGGNISKIEVDTNHFKGNFPESCSIQGCAYPDRDLNAADFRDRPDLKWVEILPRTQLQAHTRHYFEKELRPHAAREGFDYIRLNIFPDGGISDFAFMEKRRSAELKISLAEFNQLASVEALQELLRCCGSHSWARQMEMARPFERLAELFEKSERVWKSLEKKDWLEAFSHHPRIGDLNTLTAKWEAEEQNGAKNAPKEVLLKIAAGNDAYQDRFGYLFLVCATGKSAEEMLGLLEQRLLNSPEAEIDIAAAEQAKITRIRLEKLFL